MLWIRKLVLSCLFSSLPAALVQDAAVPPGEWQDVLNPKISRVIKNTSFTITAAFISQCSRGGGGAAVFGTFWEPPRPCPWSPSLQGPVVYMFREQHGTILQPEGMLKHSLLGCFHLHESNTGAIKSFIKTQSKRQRVNRLNLNTIKYNH